MSGSYGPLGATPNTSSASNSILVHSWQGKVLILSPTKTQYRNMPKFLRYAQALDQYNVAAVLVNAPSDTEEEITLPLKTHTSSECLSYEVRQQEYGIFQVQLPFCTDTLRPIPESSSDAISALELLDQLEDLLASSKDLKRTRYLPDIPVKTLFQRQQAGLPVHSKVWPNKGDQLEPLPKKTPGLHSPFAYVADERFGAIFNCHREDYDLHSIN